MIHRKYKARTLFLVITISLLATWQGKNNLAWFASQVSGKDCSVSWLFVKCE